MDGRWMAYTSDESGRFEVYVGPFPSGDAKWKASTAGGEQSRWRRDGKELYYLAPDRTVMAVPVKADAGTRPAFEAGTPQALFETRVPTMNPAFAAFQYDVSGDGKRFLVQSTRQESSEAPITVVVNWQGGVRK